MMAKPGHLATWMRGPLRAIRHLAHLSVRFLGSLSPRPPNPADEAWAEGYLTEAEIHLWRQLSNRDRRHCISVARRFAAPDRSRAELAGALLHDIGKIESDLGVLGRVSATIIGPRTNRQRIYHDHESRGVELLEQIGSDPVTVELVAGSGRFADALRSIDDAVLPQLPNRPMAR